MPHHLHVPTWDVQRQGKPCRGLGISIPKSQTQGTTTHAISSAGLLVSWAGESWNNPSQGNAWREADLGVEFLWSTPQKTISSKRQREKPGRVLCLQKDCVSKTSVYSRARLLSFQFNFCAHTLGKSSFRLQRWIYILYVNTWAQSLYAIITAIVANSNNNSDSFFFLPSVPFSFLSQPPFLLPLDSSDRFSPFRVSDHKWRQVLEEWWAGWMSHRE